MTYSSMAGGYQVQRGSHRYFSEKKIYILNVSPQGKDDICTMNEKVMLSKKVLMVLGEVFGKCMCGNVSVINDLWLKML